MITGMPSGRVLVLSPAFGMYTRRTGDGLHELRVACTCTATSARAWLVNATSPSTPAVPRPLLRCVTRRTLTSVFDQLRSMSFCRSLTSARFPSRAALKILPRSRRTRSRSLASPPVPRPHRRTPHSGPRVRSPKCPTCPSAPTSASAFTSKAHLPTSHPHGLRAPGSISSQLVVDPPEEVPVLRSTGSCCLSAAGIRFLGTLSRRDSAPLTVGLPFQPRTPAHLSRTHSGVSTFRMRETRTGPGALSTPGTAVFAGHRVFRGRRLPPLNDRSLSPRHRFPARNADITRHHREFPDSRPSGPSPRL